MDLRKSLVQPLKKSDKKDGSIEDIFILCETCHWCATYFDESRLPIDYDTR